MSAERLTPTRTRPDQVGATGLSGVQQNKLYHTRRNRIARMKALGYLYLPDNGGYIDTPWVAAFNTDDLLRVKIDVLLADWTPGSVVVGGRLFDGGDTSWRLEVATSGAPQLVWTTDGTTLITDTSSATLGSVGIVDGDRVILQVTAQDNGDSTRDVTFEYSRTWNAPLTQLSLLDDITVGFAGFDPHDLAAGSLEFGGANVDGRIYRAEVETDSGLSATMNVAEAPGPGGGSTAWRSSQTAEEWTLDGTNATLVFP